MALFVHFVYSVVSIRIPTQPYILLFPGTVILNVSHPLPLSFMAQRLERMIRLDLFSYPVVNSRKTADPTQSIRGSLAGCMAFMWVCPLY